VLIYLPIAELSVNMLIILGMGGAVGFLSGLFGVGGGFLLTPLLIFSGVPPVVSVATVATQVVASSASAALSYWRRRMVDMKLATALMLSGIVGTLIGAAVALAISFFSPVSASIELWSVALGIGITAAVGLFFGLYPAMRAASLDPIEALRRE